MSSATSHWLSFDLRAQAIPGNEVFPEPDYWVDSETFIREYKAMLADIVSRAGDLRAAFICKPPPLRDGSSRKWSRELIHGELQDDVDEVAAWFANEYDVYSTTVDFFGALGGDDAQFGAVWKSSSETTSRRWRGAPEI